MKKRLSVLILALVCLLALTGCCFHSEWQAATCTTPKTCVECGETEGEALGHSWADATCTAPKTCAVCNLTEGQALGHTWVDATTEAPKTCTVCAATEGERIITDPRFTTAATKDLQGKWVGILAVPPELMGAVGLNVALEMEVTLELGNDGTMKMGYAIANLEAFIADLKDYMVTYMYDQFAESNYNKEQADALAMKEYGMTVPELVSTAVDSTDFSSIEDTLAAMGFSGVYFVEGDQFCSGLSWDGAIAQEDFTLEGDTFTLQTDFGGYGVVSLALNRASE